VADEALPVDPDEPDDDQDDAIVPGASPLTARVDEAMRLLVWMRKQGFRCGTLAIGELTFHQLRDDRPRFVEGQRGSGGPRDAFEDYDPTIYGEGGNR